MQMISGQQSRILAVLFLMVLLPFSASVGSNKLEKARTGVIAVAPLLRRTTD